MWLGCSDADATRTVVRRQRLEKRVDAIALAATNRGRRRPHVRVHGFDAGGRREQENAVVPERRRAVDLAHGELRVRLQQLDEMAIVMRRPVHGDDERSAGVVRQAAEQRAQRLQPARRRADADDERRHARGRLAGRVLGHPRVARHRTPTRRKSLLLVPVQVPCHHTAMPSQGVTLDERDDDAVDLVV
jgi:hypothetical protein